MFHSKIKVNIPNGFEVCFGENKLGTVVSSKNDLYEVHSVCNDGNLTSSMISAADLTIQEAGKIFRWDRAGLLEALYIPEMIEMGQSPYCKLDFINIASGDEALAFQIFSACDWQYPEVIAELLADSIKSTSPVVINCQ